MEKLVVLGDYAWDVLVRTDRDLLRGGDTFGEVSLSPGGSAANVAVWGQRCGLAATFATGVSAWVVERSGARPQPDAALGELLKAHVVQRAG